MEINVNQHKVRNVKKLQLLRWEYLMCKIKVSNSGGNDGRKYGKRQQGGTGSLQVV